MRQSRSGSNSRKTGSSQTQLALIIGISCNGVTKNIDWLKEHGYVERVGGPRTGWWNVLQ